MNRHLFAFLLALSSVAFSSTALSSEPDFVFPDVVKLRKELLAQPDFDGFGMEGAEHEAILSAHVAWKEGHGDKTLDILVAFLRKYPASISGWRNKAEASEACANVAKVPEHKDLFARVAKREREMQTSSVQSILDSADGKSEATAYPALEISEEYELVNWLHFKPQSQSLLHAPTTGRSYDVLKLKDESGKDVVLYFDITNFWASENRIFSKPSPPKPDEPAVGQTPNTQE